MSQATLLMRMAAIDQVLERSNQCADLHDTKHLLAFRSNIFSRRQDRSTSRATSCSLHARLTISSSASFLRCSLRIVSTSRALQDDRSCSCFKACFAASLSRSAALGRAHTASHACRHGRLGRHQQPYLAELSASSRSRNAASRSLSRSALSADFLLSSSTCTLSKETCRASSSAGRCMHPHVTIFRQTALRPHAVKPQYLPCAENALVHR